MNDSEDLTLDECAHRLGLRPGRLRRVIRDGDFPEPAGPDTGEPRWREADVLRWAAASGPELAARIPLPYWPDVPEPAAYLGASEHGKDAVLMTWQAGAGRVAVLWDTHPSRLSLPDLVRRVDGVTVLVHVLRNFGIDGPGVTAVNGATSDETYGLRRSDLSRVLGQPMPVSEAPGWASNPSTGPASTATTKPSASTCKPSSTTSASPPAPPWHRQLFIDRGPASA